MKIEMRCKHCGKDQKVKSIYVAESGALNFYLNCGHHIWDFKITLRER